MCQLCVMSFRKATHTHIWHCLLLSVRVREWDRDCSDRHRSFHAIVDLPLFLRLAWAGSDIHWTRVFLGTKTLHAHSREYLSGPHTAKRSRTMMKCRESQIWRYLVHQSQLGSGMQLTCTLSGIVSQTQGSQIRMGP